VRRALRAALALLTLAAAAGLAACGSGGTTTTTTTTTVSVAPVAKTASTPATTASAPAHTATPPPAETTHHSSAPSGTASGGAASFKVAHGDNSIPEYGQEASSSERQRAATALAAFLKARAAGEWAQACAYLTRTTRKQLELFAKATKGKVSGCAPILAAFSRDSAASRADLYSGSVAAVRIKGRSAFALFHGPHASKYVMPMVNEGGAWKVGDLAPLPYPLGSTPTP
jgi:hypothetical protein